MSNFKSGIDAFTRKLDKLAANARKLDGKHEVKLTELFNTNFMRQHASVESFEALIRAGGFENVEFEAIPDDDWDKVVAKYTSFANWSEMRQAGVQEWAHREMTRGV